ncbi:hypothetical protein FRB96_000450 [Tulasnella sp. 330]|nr:hypothetical protein FRB96_000450 [Tulasnella sp. 330]
MLVSRASDLAPHLHGYSPQQTQQLDALASAHRAAQQQQQPHPNQPLYATRRSATAPSASSNLASAPSLPPVASLAPNEQTLVSLIATLSSQHHHSEYSKMKLGDRGCPAVYLPLSITVPRHVEELRQRQAVNVSQSCLFRAPRTAYNSGAFADLASLGGIAVRGTTPEAHSSVAMENIDQGNGVPHLPEAEIPLPPSLDTTPLSSPSIAQTPAFPLSRSRSVPSLQPPSSPFLQQAISLAISSPLAVLPPRSPLQPTPPPTPVSVSNTPKTSETHPINISYLVPPEYIPFISSHLFSAYPQYFRHQSRSQHFIISDLMEEPQRPQEEAQPTLPQFTLPSHLRFDSFVAHQAPMAFVQPQQTTHANTVPTPMPYRSSTSPRLAQRRQSRTDEQRPWPAKSVRAVFTPSIAGRSLLSSQSSNMANGVTVSTSEADIQQAISEALLPFKADSKSDNMHVDVSQPLTRSLSSRSNSSNGTPTDEVPLTSLPFPLTGSALPAAREAVATPPPPPAASPPKCFIPVEAPTSGPQIGNFLLSSCPGKKVRLTGPIKGRGAICRSLPQDLARIRSLGVGLIINCLDDVELEFLGAPWPQYVETAQSLGLDVLRIPTPEGLAPLDATRLDNELSWVIREYTLKGINVLVHCRGGVGRAGLVASCWMIKMGLCGPVDEAFAAAAFGAAPLQGPDSPLSSPVRMMPWTELMQHGRVRRETFHLIQRVVTTIRRRRSVKAIETYEQARFLIDFAELLRESQGSELVLTRDRMEKEAATVAPTLEVTPSLKVEQEATSSSITTDGDRSPVPSLGQGSIAATDNTLAELDESTSSDEGRASRAESVDASPVQAALVDQYELVDGMEDVGSRLECQSLTPGPPPRIES